MIEVTIQVKASSQMEATTKAMHLQKIGQVADIETLKILADKASPASMNKLKQFKHFL